MYKKNEGFSKLNEGYQFLGWTKDLETKELIFSYEELPTPPQEPTEIEIMQEKISILEAENQAVKEVMVLKIMMHLKKELLNQHQK